MRIDKVLEEKGFGSRKTVKRLFQRRLVEVDGVTLSDGSFNVDTRIHQITVNGQPVANYTHTYLVMNKPSGVVTAVTDASRQTVLDLLHPEDRVPGLYPVGRLDRDTEGLLFLTDNGQLGYQLLLPDKKVTKTYEAVVNEEVTEADVAAFANGITFIGGETCQPAVLTIIEAAPGRSRVQLEIQEGKFHQVKKMFLAQGKKVMYLKRIAMGPLTLDEMLAPGEYRPCTDAELIKLKPYFRYKEN